MVLFIVLVYTLISSVSFADFLQEKRIGVLDLGVNNGRVNTEIFKYSDRTQQGSAYVEFNGQRSLFIAVRCGNKKGEAKGQEGRIVQFVFKNGYLNSVPVCFSEVLPIGHCQGFGSFIKDGELYFVCQSKFDRDVKHSYRGVSIVHWRGSATNKNDVEQIMLLDDNSPFSFITPTLSPDGRYLICLCKNSSGGYSCLMYDMPSLTQYAKPIKIFDIKSRVTKDNSWQAVCADERFIYFLNGPIYSVKPHVLSRYSYDGFLVSEYLLQNEKSIYGGDRGLMYFREGVPWNIEPETITKVGNSIYLTGICTVYFYGDIVSWNNRSYTCIKNTDGTQKPNDLKFWFPTTFRPTKGEFKEGCKYTSGKDLLNNGYNFYNRYKYVYELRIR